jgi:DNA-binding winged helix-turn-helix (wHTH) protein
VEFAFCTFVTYGHQLSTEDRDSVRRDFELEPDGELHSGGRKIKLQEQPLHILRILMEHQGDIVTSGELQHKLRPSDTFVDFDHGINNAIKRLREALGD